MGDTGDFPVRDRRDNGNGRRQRTEPADSGKRDLSGTVRYHHKRQGGGSPKVKAEISEAMEALFGLPPHKIKVLKRVE